MRDSSLPALRARLRRRYPGITILAAMMCMLEDCGSRESRPRQVVRFQGRPEDLIAAGLLTQEQFEMIRLAGDDFRRRRPTSEFGDQLVADLYDDGSLGITHVVDTAAPDDDEATMRRIDSAKLRREVDRMLKPFRTVQS